MKAQMEISKHEKLAFLHGIRGLAALSVLLYHAGPLMSGVEIFGSGYLAVDLFFVLSGFVLARAYDGRLAGGLSFLEFMKRRLVRLYPIYLLGLMVSLLSVFVLWVVAYQTPSISKSAMSWVFSVAYLPTPPFLSPIPEKLYPLNGVFWTLALELLANIFYALFSYRFNKAANLVVISIMAAGLVFAALQFGSADGGAEFHNLYVGFFRIGFSYFLGSMLGKYWRLFHLRGQIRLPIIVGAVLLVLFLSPSASVRPYYDLFVIMVVWPVILIASANVTMPPAFQQISDKAGDLSYAIYAIHAPLLTIAVGVSFFFTGRGWQEQGLPVLVIGLVAIVVMSDLCVRFYDVPLRKFLQGKFLRKLGAAR